MDTNFYDVVVCGGDLPGVIAAALLGRRGLRVLLCGHDREPTTFQAGGYTLTTGPGLLPPPDSEAVTRILRELNYVQIIRQRAPQLSPPFQLLLPDARLDFGPNTEAMERQFAREFPSSPGLAAALARIHEISARLEPLLGSDITLPPDNFWERREVARVDGALSAGNTDAWGGLGDHPVRKALAACAALSCNFGPGDVGPVAEARALDLARRGLCRLEGGMAGLRNLFIDKIHSYSSDIRERVTPVGLITKRGKITGLRVRPRDETIGLNHLVWAGSAASLLPLCEDKNSRRVREIAAAIHPACYRYVLCLLLRPEAIPEGMGPRVFAIADPTRPAIEDNALAFTVGEISPRQADRVPVWIECFVPAAAAASGSGYFSIIRGRIRERLTHVIPFFERHLLVMASPHDGLAPELSPDARSAPPPEPITPMPMAAAFNCDLPRTLQVGGAPHATDMKNVLLASNENLPGLGREGDFIAAWGIVRLILGSQSKKDVGRRDILIEDS